MKRADTTTIEVRDPNCKGVTDPTGRKVYRKDARGRIELPTYEAKRILASGHRDTRLACSTFGLGVAAHDEGEYEAWLEASDRFLSFTEWRRLIKHKGA